MPPHLDANDGTVRPGRNIRNKYRSALVDKSFSIVGVVHIKFADVAIGIQSAGVSLMWLQNMSFSDLQAARIFTAYSEAMRDRRTNKCDHTRRIQATKRGRQNAASGEAFFLTFCLVLF